MDWHFVLTSLATPLLHQQYPYASIRPKIIVYTIISKAITTISGRIPTFTDRNAIVSLATQHVRASNAHTRTCNFFQRWLRCRLKLTLPPILSLPMGTKSD
jgi:hypothetical protein